MSHPWALSSLGTRPSISPVSPCSTCAPPTYARFRAPRCNVFRQSCTTSSRERLLVVCMAHPRRVARVASQIQREIGDMFVYDPVIQAAICPERKGGGDTLSAVASITNTYVSNDLQVVKVYVSVYSDDYGKRVALQNLVRLEPYVRRVIGQRVRLRRTPEVRFVYDDSEEEADLVVRVIGREEVERYRSEIESEMAPGARPSTSVEAEAPGQKGDEGEAEDEDEDEDDEDEMYDDPDELPQEYPNPFGDLFGDTGDEDAVVVGRGKKGQGRPDGEGRRSRGRGGRGRGGSRGAQAARQQDADHKPGSQAGIPDATLQ